MSSTIFIFMENVRLDVLVLGSGTAGKTVAEKCAKAGRSVGLIENGQLGGTCSNEGCDPKKVLYGATEILQRFRDFTNLGVQGDVSAHWGDLQNFKRSFTKDIPENTRKDLNVKGIHLFLGEPKFLQRNIVQISDYEISADKIVIATGLKPRMLTIEGKSYLKNSRDFLKLKKLPKKIVFLGAGFIGLEFAHMAARGGSRVTIIDSGNSILDNFDKDLTKLLRQDSENLGIKFIFSGKIKALEKNKNFILHYEKQGVHKSITTDIVFNTTGRVPSLEEMNLKAGGIDHNDNGILVDDYMRCKTNADVYACGDISNNALPLSPLSRIEADIVAANILNKDLKKILLPPIPSVVFTIPQIAMVGYSEEEAKNRCSHVVVKYGVGSDWYNNKRINGASYAYKILIDERTDEILGAHLLGPEASEIINIFSLSMHKKITVKELKNTIFTYPSWANDIKSMLSEN
ncbi:MAG: NAD(P)/FAD-dependent oxidoreductase [Maribacter sp.]